MKGFNKKKFGFREGPINQTKNSKQKKSKSPNQGRKGQK